MNYIVSFCTLYNLHFDIKEVDTLDGLVSYPSEYTYSKFFLNKEEAYEYFETVKYFMLNLEFVNKISYRKDGFYDTEKGKGIYKKMHRFYKHLVSYQDKNTLLEEFMAIWSNLETFELLSTELIEKSIQELQDFNELTYWSMVNSEEDKFKLLNKYKKEEVNRQKDRCKALDY